MQGRLENELKITAKTEAKLNEMPFYVTEWYNMLSASGKTAATCLDYVQKICKFLSSISSDTSEVDVSEITQNAVVSYFKNIKMRKMNDGSLKETSFSLRQTTWSALHNFCKFLCDSGYIEKNYVDAISRPRGNDLERINDHRILLTKEDFSKILSCIEYNYYGRANLVGMEKRDYAIMVALMATGMRKTALSTINVEDIDTDDMTLRIVDKGNRYIKYKISNKLANALSDWLDVRMQFETKDSGDALFLSHKGNRISAREVDYLVAKYSEEALGYKISPHKLRSGFITIMVNQTGNIALASKMVGHKNVATTNRYYATGGKETEQAAAIIDSIL